MSGTFIDEQHGESSGNLKADVPYRSFACSVKLLSITEFRALIKAAQTAPTIARSAVNLSITHPSNSA